MLTRCIGSPTMAMVRRQYNHFEGETRVCFPLDHTGGRADTAAPANLATPPSTLMKLSTHFSNYSNLARGQFIVTAMAIVGYLCLLTVIAFSDRINRSLSVAPEVPVATAAAAPTSAPVSPA